MFIRERCNVGAEFSVPIHELYAAWTHWSDSKGWKTSGTEQTFGRDLRAALPFISTRQPRNNFGERHREYIGIGLNHSASGTQWHASQPIVRVGES
jgi:putative DNA primase/helicase